MISRVVLASRAQRDLLRVPQHIRKKLHAWVELVMAKGLRWARTIPGYHDEPLHGDRKGQRSIRLSRGYRAFYVTTEKGEIEIVTVVEVNKHDY